MPCRKLERYCPRFWLPALGRPVQPCRLAGAQTPSGRRCFWPLTARSGVTRAAPPPRCWSGRTPLAASACRWAPEPAFPANNWEGMHQVVAIQRLLTRSERPSELQTWFTLTEAVQSGRNATGWWMQRLRAGLWVQHDAACIQPGFCQGG